MKYNVATLREAGLEAKWKKTRSGCPILVARKNADQAFFYVDKPMWERAQLVGIAQAFDEFTCLGDFFSIRV